MIQNDPHWSNLIQIMWCCDSKKHVSDIKFHLIHEKLDFSTFVIGFLLLWPKFRSKMIQKISKTVENDQNTVFQTYYYIHVHMIHILYTVCSHIRVMCTRWGIPYNVCINLLQGLRITPSGYEVWTTWIQ